MSVQHVEISAVAVAFTVVCETCAARGWEQASFAGRLDLDLEEGLFLCRRGHGIRIIRTELAARDLPATEAA